jgi:hypothetical protein
MAKSFGEAMGLRSEYIEDSFQYLKSYVDTIRPVRGTDVEWVGDLI